MNEQTPPTEKENNNLFEPSDEKKTQNQLDVQNFFPIIGIGASAGGLEVLEIFLKHVPENSGFAFIIIQHLDPTHKGILPDILQRVTSMTVQQAQDQMSVQPNNVYVIPPNKNMSILQGKLYLFQPIESRGLRLPIDYFFRSLAEDQQQHSIAVILSGMGSDGSLGIRTIKEKGGIVLVQDPKTAKFDGMPRNAVETSIADFVVPVEEMPSKIISYLKYLPVRKNEISQDDEWLENNIEKILIMIQTHTGNNFSQYKKNTIFRRIERRMSVHQIEKINEYVRFLQENQKEIDILFKELLIGVTNFFRDPPVWDHLKKKIIPALMDKHSPEKILRAWVPACSTGEEAYSLAIVFKELMSQVKLKGNLTVQIFATDMDKDAIISARQGKFPENITADVTPERLERFFIKEDNKYQINKEIREMILFAPHNVIKDPPFTKMNIITCRNLLIYLNLELQQTLLNLFNYSLNPDGILVLGNAESINGFDQVFTPMNEKFRIYQRNTFPVRLDQIKFISSNDSLLKKAIDKPKTISSDLSFQSQVNNFILQKYSPPAILVNNQGDILYINGRTGKYLELASGKVNMNIFAMARDGLRSELAGAFQKACTHKKTIVKNIKVGTNGGIQLIDLSVELIEDPELLNGMLMVLFFDVEQPPDIENKPETKKSASIQSRRIKELEQELKKEKEQLQIVIDEMHMSQEELTSTNEELQSTNEELQSTNEELTTSKEEIQSMNEELQVLNSELQAKLNELSRVNNDMKNLLDSIEVATIFLSNELTIQRYTAQASKIIKLIPGDIGRPIIDLSSILLYPELSDDAREVLRTLVIIEKKIQTNNEKWFIVKIMPYRTLDNLIDGVVITFTDITKYYLIKQGNIKSPANEIDKERN